MPKLPVITAKKLIRILKKNGYQLDHITGSHHIMYRPDDGRRLTVPVHGKDMAKGTLNAIIKASGLNRGDF